MSDMRNRIAEYLSLGGLFNPELMDHEKVRDLIIDCQKEIQYLNAQLKMAKEVIKKASSRHCGPFVDKAVDEYLYAQASDETVKARTND